MLTGATAPALQFTSTVAAGSRQRQAVRDFVDGAGLWRLALTLGWLDIRLRYRGSVLGPFWLTLSTAIMVAALGVLYSALFKMELHDYLPFLALSIVLWNYLQTLVTDACTCFQAAENLIRSIRMPFSVHAARVVVRNIIVLAHNIVVIVAVYAVFSRWPGWDAVLAIPAMALWVVDSVAACLLLGAFCARFRDIPPIVASVMQIAFFISPIIWEPSLVGQNARWLPFNPFFSVLEIVRGPLLGTVPSAAVYASAVLYSLLLCVGSWLLFARVRGRVAFWI